MRVKRVCLHCQEPSYVYKGGKYDHQVFVCRSCIRGLTENFRHKVMQ